MKRICFIIAALVLVFGFSQCKKGNDTNPTVEGIKITLSVDEGSKVNVNPGTGTVTFQDGDVIYVGSGGNYVGSLTRTSGVFTGNISNLVEGEPLYFYFLGNVTPTIKGKIFTVSIMNQSSSLPIISCGISTINYSSAISSYSAKLLNKCALVKFNVTTSSSTFTNILGFNNKMTIDFSTNTLTPGKDGRGAIRLASGNGEKWAVLLPQDALGTGGAYTSGYVGSHDAVPAIHENDYLSSGITVSVCESRVVDLGLPSGTLWSAYNIGAVVPEEYGEYYAWGEITTKTPPYEWSNYRYSKGNYNKLTKYCNNSNYGYNGFTDNLTILDWDGDDVADAEWGEYYRMPKKEELEELCNSTTRTWTTRNGVNGWLLTGPNGNSIFLPAAGYCYGSLSGVGVYGGYWSSSLYTPSPYNAWVLSFGDGNYGMSMSYGNRYAGQSIRPVYE